MKNPLSKFAKALVSLGYVVDDKGETWCKYMFDGTDRTDICSEGKDTIFIKHYVMSRLATKEKIGHVLSYPDRFFYALNAHEERQAGVFE